MEILAKKDGRIFGAMTIQSPDGFTCPFSDVLYPCLIWDHEGNLSGDERYLLARKLIDSGCRYAVCGGKHFKVWHDTIHWAYIDLSLGDNEEDDSNLVMTSWHEDESPDDVARYFVTCTDFPQYNFKNYLVLHIGDSLSHLVLNEFVRENALSKEAP